MRRILICAVILLLGMSCVCALADGPLDPYFAETRPLIRPTEQGFQRRGATVSVEVPEDIQTGESVLFTAAGDGEYTYYFCVLSRKSGIVYHYNYYDRTGTNDGTFTYTFYYPGDYWLRVLAEDGVNDTVVTDRFFSVTGEDYLAEKVSEIADMCPGGGEYEIALWLHDYIVNHAYYDSGYTRYTADGVLISGFGVCDSYSKAYEMLLAAFNIDSQRVTSTSHAWNAVYMEDAWYNVDVTWDDPGTEAVAVSGNERYDYFGLPNSILFRVSSHQPEDENYPDCDSVACNYTVRTGNMPWHEAVVQSILDNLDAYESRFRIELATTYPIGDGWQRYISEPVITYGLSRYVLQQGIGYRDRAVTLAADYDPDADKWGMTVEAHYVLSDAERLVVTASEIGEEAFRGSGGSVVVIAGDCERLAEGVFADMPMLDEVHIPATVTEIEDTAFDGCAENLLIVAPGDSVAAQFAMDNSYCLEIEMGTEPGDENEGETEAGE